MSEQNTVNVKNQSIMNTLKMEKIKIKDKSVFIFEEHQKALYPWACIKRKKPNIELNLFSFDFHTDTHEPFLNCICDRNYINYIKQQKLISDIDYRDDKTVLTAIDKLKNDEQIKTAIKCGIFNHVFIVSHNGKEEPTSIEETKHQERLEEKDISGNDFYKLWFEPTPKESRTYPSSDIYMPYFKCSNNNELIDDNLLRGFFEDFNRMSELITVEGVIQTEYVLDIDLDYFTTPNALKPKKHRIFTELVKNAAAITIAKESICVNDCSKGKSSADDLLKELLLLIEGILSN